MEILRHIGNRKITIPKPVLTMGSFDGLHLGHQALLRRVVENAKGVGGSSVVLTFEPHPLKLLAPERAPRLILTHKDKMALLRFAGVDVVIIQEFHQAFAGIEAREFVEKYLVGCIGVHRVWVGRDFRFGKGRTGSVESLIQWGSEAGFEVKIMEPVGGAGDRISSSRLRDQIGKGEVDTVSKFLGRYHFITGRVVPGHQRGKGLGFPTANVASKTEVLPSDGIYATYCQLGDRRWPSVTNIGHNPTFGDGDRTVESFLLDYKGDLYGQTVQISFVKRIREEKKFSSVDLLVEQIQRDVLTAREIFREIDAEERLGLEK